MIHSIDGPGLRNAHTQEYLAYAQRGRIIHRELAQLPRVHVIASIDHIRGNLLFSASALSHFQFVYHDATTYEPYFYEKMYSAQVTQSYSGISSSGIQYVLSSLTTNHLKILLLISRETAGVKEGLSFSALYEFCLNEMLVSSEKSLQLIMKELEVRMRVWIEL